jgi:hypothetical protein
MRSGYRGRHGQAPVAFNAMTGYRAPLRDMEFVLRHLVGLDDLARLDGSEHATPDVVMGLLAEVARGLVPAVTAGSEPLFALANAQLFD